MLRTSKNTSIYTNFWRNPLIKTIDGYDETVHHGLFWKCRSRRIVDGASRRSRRYALQNALNRAPWIVIGWSRCAPRPFHQSHYNSLNLSTCADVIRWTLSPHDPRADFQCAVDPMLLPSPRVLHLKTVWNLVPHWEN